MPDTPGADVAAVGSKRREAPVDGVGADSERRRQREHHRRVPQRKEETDPEGTFAVLKELTSRVADRRYVVDVERVPQTEGVGKRSQTAERPDSGARRSRTGPNRAGGAARPPRRSQTGGACPRASLPGSIASLALDAMLRP